MRKPARAFGAVALIVACTGLDPGKFRPDPSPPPNPAVAGYAFDAGPGPDRAGASGSRETGGASSGAHATSGSGSGSDSGGAGDDEGGAGGVVPGAGRGGASGGNAGHGGITGGRSGSGGIGGRDSGGGRGGNAGAGGKAGAGTASGSGAGGGAGHGGPTAHALFFSEYVEGSSSYKALEITAREDSTLAGCRLATYFNGSSSASGIALDGTLSAGSAYVLCSSGLSTLLGAVCQRTTNLTFNGDDAVALECDGASLDVIGQIGVDPGDAWGSGEASTLNHSLRRSCSASAGDGIGSDPFDPSSEWLALPTDSFDGLGSAECSGG